MEGLKMKYFVLNPNKKGWYGKASRMAIKTYAEEIRPENYILAHDLEEWIKQIEDKLIKETI